MVDATPVLGHRSRCADEFTQKHKVHRATIRALGEQSNDEILTAHTAAFSAVVSYQSRVSGENLQPSNESTNAQLVLVSQFIQGIEFTKSAISEGLYFIAANLLKQELEIIAAIDSHVFGIHEEGKLRGFKPRLKGFSRKYGELNEIAHPTRLKIVEALSFFVDEERQGPTTIPQFNREHYRNLLGFHALLLIELTPRMQSLLLTTFRHDLDAEETALVVAALSLLEKQGICSPDRN